MIYILATLVKIFVKATYEQAAATKELNVIKWRSNQAGYSCEFFNVTLGQTILNKVNCDSLNYLSVNFFCDNIKLGDTELKNYVTLV